MDAISDIPVELLLAAFSGAVSGLLVSLLMRKPWRRRPTSISAGTAHQPSLYIETARGSNVYKLRGVVPEKIELVVLKQKMARHGRRVREEPNYLGTTIEA